MRKVRNVSVLVALSAGVLLMSGRIQGQDLVGAGQLSLEKIEAEGVRVMWTEVRQQGDVAIVTGSLLPRNPAVRQYRHGTGRWPGRRWGLGERAERPEH